MQAKKIVPERSPTSISFFLLWVLLCTFGMANIATAAPAFQAAGTAVNGTGSVSPAWPTHAIGDVALLFIESAGGEPATLSTAAGFAAVSNSPQATGTGTNGTQITVFWARATSTTMATPTVADPGNHVYAQILTYRGVINSGNPWDVTGGGVKATAGTSVTVTGVTTSVPDTLIVQAVARDDDTNAAEFSNQTNTNLTGVTERTDAGTTSGNGGGFAVWDGVKATAGATGSTTATVVSSINAFLTIALKRIAPTVTSVNLASTNPTAPATSVSWTVSFSTSVTGVDTTDFSLVQAGGVTGASITSVTGSGTTWTVNANTGAGGGTLGLNLVDDDTIVNASALPLGDVGTGNGNFAGQVYSVFSCTPPANTPAGLSLSCQCDTFSRATLNPSTIFGSNWIVSSSDSTGILPSIVNSGYLRLTNNTGNNAKAVTVPGIFPAAGNYISVEFQQYAYNGSGADGIAVTLSDYTVPAVPGAYGGSLGYAQETGIHDGFAGGWLGVGLDEYGNYQNTNEGRLGGPGFTVQSVGARGSGAGQTGYRWLGGTGSLTPKIDNNTSTSPSLGYYYQVIVDARNEPASTAIAVNRDTGGGYAPLISIPNVYTAATAQGFTQASVPANWQISFTGSTGGSTNIHEIGGLRICAQVVVPPTGGTASGFSAIDEAYPVAASAIPDYQNFQTGHIYMKLPGATNTFKLWVAALTGSGISSGYSTVSAKYVLVNLVDNSDNACGPDSARTCNSTCTNKAAVEAGAAKAVTFTLGGPGASLSPSFTLNSSWKNLLAIMKECTTSACTAFTATAPACSVDSFSVRPLNITSVISSNATNTGTTGTPIFKAGSDNFTLAATTSGVAGSPSGYNGVMKINNAVVQPASPATVAGAVSGSFPAATSATPSSTATGTTFTYSEVGGFKLPGYDPASDTTSRRSVYDGVATADECTTPGLTTAQCDALKSATWTGLDSISSKGDCVPDSYLNTKDASGKYGCNFGLLPNAVVFGRFVPDHFDTVISGGMPCPTGLTSCPCPVGSICPPALSNGFVYSGQSFTTQVFARNATGAVTLNYDSAKTLSKAVTLSAWDVAGGAISNPGGGALTTNTILSTAFSAGVATTSTPVYTFTTIPTAPTDIFIRAIDSDNISSLRATASASVENGLKVVSGRVKIVNAYGSEQLPLTLSATVQYWGGTSTGYVTSTTDNVNTVTAAKISRTNCQGSLLTGGVCSATLGTISSVLSVPLTPPPYGEFSIKLGAPGARKTGSEDLIVNIGGWPSYLPSSAGRATFGIYKGNNDYIYQRESY